MSVIPSVEQVEEWLRSYHSVSFSSVKMYVFAYSITTSILLFSLWAGGMFIPKRQRKFNHIISLPVAISMFGSGYLRILFYRRNVWQVLVSFCVIIPVRVSAFKWKLPHWILVIQFVGEYSAINNHFPYNFIALSVMSVGDYIMLNWSNIFVFYVLKYFTKYCPRPIVVFSKGYSITSHWHVKIGQRTFELFKDGWDTGETNTVSIDTKKNGPNHPENQTKEEEMKKLKKGVFKVTEQKRSRRVKEGENFWSLIYIPMVQRGMAGYYFGRNVELWRNYLETIEEFKKDRYRVMTNDCQWFCSRFILSLGVTFYSVFSKRWLILFVSLFIYYPILWIIHYYIDIQKTQILRVLFM